MKNWQTTLAGGLTALGMYFRNDPNPTVASIANIVMEIGVLATGILAKDAAGVTK